MFFMIKNINYNIRYFYAFFKERMSLRNKLKESEKNMGKVLKVREVGEPILEKQCNEVNIKNINEDIIDIIEDLKSTLEYGTGLGIAAPQIGLDKRIIVVGAKKENIKYNDAEEIPITAMINPTWKKLSEDTDVQYEGCMSVPSIRGKVERYKNIELTYYNENGEKIVNN